MKTMKNIWKLLSVAALVVLAFTACEKEPALPYYDTGVVPGFTATPTTGIVLSTNNATTEVVKFGWTDPQFSVDKTQYKYVLEVAPAGSNFANPARFTVMDAEGISLTGTQLNNLLINWGAKYGEATQLETRVVASYANNNDQKISETVAISVAPYATPFTLSRSSAAGTEFNPTIETRNDVLESLNWTKPAYAENVQMTYSLQYDSTGKNFANAKTWEVGHEVYTRDLSGIELNIMARDAGIAYGAKGSVAIRIKAVIDGTGQVSYSNPVNLVIKPAEMTLYLWVAGDFQGWSPETGPRLSSTDGVNYDGYVYVPAGGTGEFKFTKAPNWGGGDYGTGSGEGTLGNGGNIKWPATGKHYRVWVNTVEMKWGVTEITTWGVIGSGTPGGWDSSTPLTYDAATKTWRGTVNFSNGEFKFRANNGWDINIGGNPDQMTYGGDNIPVTAGSKTVILNLDQSPNYSFRFQ